MKPDEGTRQQLGTAYVTAVIGALCISWAWLLPGSGLCALLGWLSAWFLVAATRRCYRLKDCHHQGYHQSHHYLPLYSVGLICNSLGFYWLFNTVKDFGGFPAPVAALIFVFFVVLSAFQFLFFAFFYFHRPRFLDHWGCGVALAWVSAELLSIRIFPWHLGHTQSAFSYLAQSAEWGGTLLISFMLLWVTESLYLAIAESRQLRRLTVGPILLGPILLIVLLFLGSWRLNDLGGRQDPLRRQEVALVQANVKTEEKRNVRLFKDNTQDYIRLSEETAKEASDLIIIWPESALQVWVPATVGHLSNDSRLPWFGPNSALLAGTLTFAKEKGVDPDNVPDKDTERVEFFNSVIAILPDGRIPAPYHKRILMPFGEFMPGARYFPAIKRLNPAAGDFSAGTRAQVFSFPAPPGQQRPPLRLAPLICYEDVVSSMAREAVLAGAEVLVNLTNDAWFGDSAAQHQHHLIASFRAIENRRYLLRSTNSGLTAIVNPLGQSIASLPTFSEGVLKAEISPLNIITVYTRVGDWPWWLAAIGLAISSLWRWRRLG